MDHSATCLLLKGKCKSEPSLKANQTNWLPVREEGWGRRLRWNPTMALQWNTEGCPCTCTASHWLPQQKRVSAQCQNTGLAPEDHSPAAGPQTARVVVWKHYLKDNNSLSSSGKGLSFWHVQSTNARNILKYHGGRPWQNTLHESLGCLGQWEPGVTQIRQKMALVQNITM